MPQIYNANSRGNIGTRPQSAQALPSKIRAKMI